MTSSRGICCGLWRASTCVGSIWAEKRASGGAAGPLTPRAKSSSIIDGWAGLNMRGGQTTEMNLLSISGIGGAIGSCLARSESAES